MKLYLVRHAQTNYNALGLCNSDPSVDVHLSSLGIEQAKDLANQLRYADFDVIFTSELPRTKQTADIINQFHGVPTIENKLLGDNRTGFEDKPAKEWLAALASSDDKWSARFNGGESLHDASRRLTGFLKELKGMEYESVLVVTSSFPTQAIYSEIKRVPLEEAWEFILTQGTYALFDI